MTNYDLLPDLKEWAESYEAVDIGIDGVLYAVINYIEQLTERNKKLEAALHLGIDMREKQKAYFKRRFQDVLLDCKKAESAFDKAAIAALGEKKDGSV